MVVWLLSCFPLISGTTSPKEDLMNAYIPGFGKPQAAGLRLTLLSLTFAGLLMAAPGFAATCVGGPDAGKACIAANDCRHFCSGGAKANQACVAASDCGSACSGGIDAGKSCIGSSDCRQTCVGGSRAGAACVSASDCTGGTCSAP